MFVRGNGFFNLCDFIIGYSLAIQTIKNEKIDVMFYNWLVLKLDLDTNLFWPDIIYNIKRKNDREAELLLFDLMEEFFSTIDDNAEG